MVTKVLVANRAEIAVRIIRACKEMGIRTVAIYSDADTESLHVKIADEKVCIGGYKPIDTYLNIERILQAAMETKVNAIHPGYGYLAENGDFAKRCKELGFIFIGPHPENLYLAGDKLAAKKQVKEAGVPVIPGSVSGTSSKEEAAAIAEDIGYPVIIKASAGGGGRGMRICADRNELLEEFPIAKAEAKAGFGDDTLYVEKYLIKPRHIEFQILADNSDKVIHLGERECTIQRRYQKLVEESPSPIIDNGLREKMGELAIRAAKSLNYFNAGTVEFLVDQEKKFYFVEVNARIQVEHPVTEMVTGIDILKEQIRLAFGEKLDYDFSSLQKRGWAIECRINAEDPEQGFLPCPGRIDVYYPPGGYGIRLDTHIYQGYKIPPFYDSLIAKLISYGLTRDAAIRTMLRALEEFVISPVKTTIPFHKKVVSSPFFTQGEFDTDFVKAFLPENSEEED